MTLRLGLVALGLAGWLTSSATAADQVEVLARGPVHEAYAEPSEREPTPTPIIPKEPPRPIEELPPDQKPEGANVQWMPGYWAWDDDKKDFLWVSGFWRNVPPGRAWVPGSWRKANDGWQWTGGFWSAAQEGAKADIEYLPQPPAPLDAGGATTPAPSETHVYIPGTWVYRERYVWRPGFWFEYRPGWVWVAAHYRWTPAGYIFIDGYWDYPLAERGILFAPAYIPPVVYTAPAFVYTPTYVIREECLFGAFFCRRGFGCYYFGDYFAPTYARLGFTAWCGHVGVSVSIGGGGWYDPMFGYYRCGFRHDPFWRTGVFDLYAGRYRGDYLRPPVTLVQQTTVINNITNVKNVKNVTNVNTNNVTMLTSLTNADRGGQRKLQRVPDAERQQQQIVARATRDIATRRAEGEAQLATRPGAGGKTAAPRALKLDLPPTAATGTRLKGTDPAPGKVTTGPIPPTPRPTPIGKGDPKSATIGLPKLGDPATNPAGLPKGNAKPPVAPKVGPTTPKGNLVPRSGINPVPNVDSPGPKSGTRITVPPPAALELPNPKSGDGPPAKSATIKPPASTPPVTIPKPVGKSFMPPGGNEPPVAPQEVPRSLPRINAPAPGPTVGPAPPPPSRPAPAAVRPSPPKKIDKKDRKK
ncbi:MAG: YXWGXW repeat-containing protein [Zavarzinella sp.]|nr:YXWGXW repeat-containing protein [Zavarzinella sp.]